MFNCIIFYSFLFTFSGRFLTYPITEGLGRTDEETRLILEYRIGQLFNSFYLLTHARAMVHIYLLRSSCVEPSGS